MSIVLSASMQAALFETLVTDPALSALIGDAVYDATPATDGSVPMGEYLTIGTGDIRPFDTATSAGGVHDFDVTVHSASEGFSKAKLVAAAVGQALSDAALPIAGGTTVALRFVRARAKRGAAPELRRIELRFRAVLEEIA